MEEAIYKRQIYKQQHGEMTIEGKDMPRMFEGALPGWVRVRAVALRCSAPDAAYCGLLSLARPPAAPASATWFSILPIEYVSAFCRRQDEEQGGRGRAVGHAQPAAPEQGAGGNDRPGCRTGEMLHRFSAMPGHAKARWMPDLDRNQPHPPACCPPACLLEAQREEAQLSTNN